ncbi:MAG: hypothetical protein ACJ797_15675 [Ktedonobacteraceae bacterium]
MTSKTVPQTVTKEVVEAARDNLVNGQAREGETHFSTKRRAMGKHTQSFDICVVCALYEEAEAVLDEFSMRCGVSFTKAFSGMDRYAYQHTTIQNKQGEPLTVLVTWLSNSGPTQTGLDLKPFLHEFHPRFVAMTGICAGYREKVKLGDLVVAQYAYYYEEGKIIREPAGSSRHLPEMKTADPTSQVIQYARGFDGWKKPVREMKRHKLKLNPQLRATEEPSCVVAPMASGMAVRGDDPFPWLREKYNRNTVALDMEAATFYRALRDVPQIHALVVKGVCDYADMTKDDAYHDYAARVSAIYLLSFIQEYVTAQTMPRHDVPSIKPPRRISRRAVLIGGSCYRSRACRRWSYSVYEHTNTDTIDCSGDTAQFL